MELTSEAKAVAKLDAVCDEYEQAFRSCVSSHCDDQTISLDPWLERVSPELRSWLRDELCALRQELESDQASFAEGSHHQLASEGVGIDSWNAVNESPTFQLLSYEAKLSLAKRIEPREFDSGAVLLQSGRRTRGLFLITDGQVQVVSREGASRHEIDTDGAGSVLGEMSMLTGHPCAADVVATTPVGALVLPLAAFDSLRAVHPEIEIALSQLVSDRLGHRRRDALCGKSLGGYLLQRCIGNGAMGVVYAAVDESDGTNHALKMLRHRFIYNSRVVSRFDQEAELLAQLKHANIVGLRGHFIAYRTRFIVLDLYDGADLRQAIRHHGPMNESTARGVLGQIAAGLQHAHQQGVLHLDLKPANILINREGRVAITDFGLSRLLESDGCDKDCVGTPFYMPPEQFMMANIGPHCDWYSFGCIAYELISGERLFQDDGSTQFLDDKLRQHSSAWPAVGAKEDFWRYFRTALQPIVEHRDLDLGTIATWARLVPELAVGLDEGLTTIETCEK